MSLSIAASVKDFIFDNLLFSSIKAEKLNDGEGTEHDPLEGTSFEPVNIHPYRTSASHPLATSYMLPTSAASVPTSRSGSPSPSHASMACNVDIDSCDSGSPSGIRDAKTSKKVYKLRELVGEASRFNLNLVEWDGKYIHCLCLLYHHPYVT